jgi:hypothetical protein
MKAAPMMTMAPPIPMPTVGAAGGSTHLRLGQRDVPAFDHRQALAMQALERLGSPAHGEKDEEHAGKHADHEYGCYE